MKSIRLFVPIFNKHLNLELSYESSIWIINQIDKFFEKKNLSRRKGSFLSISVDPQTSSSSLGRSTNLILGSCLWVEKINGFISIVLNYSTILYSIFYYFILSFSFIVFLLYFLLLQMNRKLQSISFAVRSKKENLNIFLVFHFLSVRKKWEVNFLFL